MTKKTIGFRGEIRELAVALLQAHPEGLRYSELHRRIQEARPDFKASTINTSIWNLDSVFPALVCKPSKGLFRHVTHSETPSARRPEAGSAMPRIREEAFYQAFCYWLENEMEEVTHAIPLGGSRFKDKWGTPDVIGKLESRRSDMIKGNTQIVSAEIKSDPTQLVSAFGQACAYRLFSHKSWMVIPRTISKDELDRIDSLCEISKVGLVTFDATNVEQPSFTVVVRPRAHEPDLFFTNRYLSLIEEELFA